MLIFPYPFGSVDQWQKLFDVDTLYRPFRGHGDNFPNAGCADNRMAPDAERASHSFRKLACHDIRRWALTGGFPLKFTTYFTDTAHHFVH